ncbi:MAG: hypothetical protein KGJ65_08275, partial [Betaproteobacteria bacterium]|nr:hypothetical protein [Betaproteobacteria bacterium]
SLFSAGRPAENRLAINLSGGRDQHVDGAVAIAPRSPLVHTMSPFQIGAAVPSHPDIQSFQTLPHAQ